MESLETTAHVPAADPDSGDSLYVEALERLEDERGRDAGFGPDDLPERFARVRGLLHARDRELSAGSDLLGLPKPPRFGERFARPWELLGHGGLGAVYGVYDARLERRVAVKVIQRRIEDNDVFREQFAREARLSARLTHPGVLPVHEFLEDLDGRPCIVMKLVEGVTLSVWLAADRTESDKVAVFEAVCAAMASAHQAEVVHRDLKPGNVMVGRFGESYVMDWGLAGDLRKPAALSAPAGPSGDTVEDVPPRGLTRLVERIGTPGYLPPEQDRDRGEEAADPRSDVYSLGVTFGQMLTGTPPDPHRGADPVREALASYPNARLRAIAEACMSPDRSARPADAGAVFQLLRAYREAVAQAESARRRLAATLAVVVTLFAAFAALAGGGIYWSWRAAEERLRSAETAERFLVVAERSAADAARLLARRRDAGPEVEQAEAALSQAEAAAAKSARASLSDAVEAARARVESASRVQRLVAALTAAESRTAARLRAFEPDTLPLAEGYRDAFAAWGVRPLDAPAEEAAAALKAADPAARPHLMSGLFTWVMAQPEAAAKLRAVARAASGPEDGALLAAEVGNDPALVVAALEASMGDPRRVYLLAMTLRRLRAEAAAVGPLGRAVLVHPDDAWLHLALADVMRALPDFSTEAVIGCLRAALAADRRNVVAWAALGDYFAATGRSAEAGECFAEAERLQPGNALLSLGRALVAMMRNDGVTARRELRGLRERYPDRLQLVALEALAECYTPDGPRPELVERLEKAVARPNPGWLAPHALGMVRLKQWRVDEAAKIFALARQDLPPRVVAGLPAVQGYLALARRAAFPEAVRLLDRTLKDLPAADPFRTTLAALRAEALGYLGRYQEAEASLAAARAAPGADVVFDAISVELLAQRGRFAEAVALWAAAEKKNPVFAKIHPTKKAVYTRMAALVAADALPPKGRWPGEHTLSDALAAFRAEAAFWAGRPWQAYLTYLWFLERNDEFNKALLRMTFHRQRSQVINDDAACLTQLSLAGLAGLRAAASPAEGGKSFADAERAAARAQALKWLAADLANQREWAGRDSYRAAVSYFVLTMRTSPDLAAVRGDAVAKLPAAERKGWAEFWRGVDALSSAVAAEEMKEK